MVKDGDITPTNQPWEALCDNHHNYNYAILNVLSQGLFSPIPAESVLLSLFYWGGADVENVASGMWVGSKSQGSHPGCHLGAILPNACTALSLERIMCLSNKAELGLMVAKT